MVSKMFMIAKKIEGVSSDLMTLHLLGFLIKNYFLGKTSRTNQETGTFEPKANQEVKAFLPGIKLPL